MPDVPAGSLRRQRTGVFCGDLYPFTQLRVGLETRLLDENPALHGPPREIEAPRVSLSQCSLRLLGGEPHDELEFVNAHAHVAIEKKGHAAEHLLLGKALAPAKRAANSIC